MSAAISGEELRVIRARAEDLYIGSDLSQAGADVRALLAELGRVRGAIEKAGNVWSHCEHAEECPALESEDEEGSECDCNLDEVAVWIDYALTGDEDVLRADLGKLPIYRAIAADGAAPSDEDDHG